MTSQKQEKFLKAKIRIREAAQDDVSFIFNSWLKSYRNSLHVASVPNEVFFAAEHTLIEGLLRNVPVYMACNHDDPAQIYGYICSEVIEGAPVVHYCYVKEPYRMLGLGKMLLEAVNIDPKQPFFVTHYTSSSHRMRNRVALICNPYLAYYAFKLGREAQQQALVGELQPSETGLGAKREETKE